MNYKEKIIKNSLSFENIALNYLTTKKLYTIFYEIKLINCYFFTLNQSNQNRLSTILTLCQIFSAKK